MKLYFAAPLFTTAERDFNAALARLLRAEGHTVYLPQEAQHRPPITAARIYGNDLSHHVMAEAIVANMDGPDPDSGTCWECGLASGAGKPVIMFRTDIRDEEPFGPYNLMLHQSAAAALDCKWLTVPEIAAVIHRALCAVTP